MKKSKFLKKSLAMLLAVMLVVAMIPLSAAAAPSATFTPAAATGQEATVTKSGENWTMVYEYTEDPAVRFETNPGETVSYVNEENVTVSYNGTPIELPTDDNGDPEVFYFTVKNGEETTEHSITWSMKAADSDVSVKSAKVDGVDAIVNESSRTIKFVLPFGSTSGTVTPDIELEGVTEQPTVSAVTVETNETKGNSVTFTVQPEDNSKDITYTVTAEEETGLTAISIGEYEGEFQTYPDGDNKGYETGDIYFNVPADFSADDLKKVVVNFEVGSNFTGATYGDADTAITNGDEIDLSASYDALIDTGIEFTIINAEGERTYDLYLVKDGTDTTITKASITIDSATYDGTVDGQNITVVVPDDADLSDITVNLTGPKATTDNPAITDLGTGETFDAEGEATIENVEYTAPIRFYVTSADGKTNTYYTLTINKAEEENTDPKITSAKMTLTDYPAVDEKTEYTGTISGTTITFNIPYSVLNSHIEAAEFTYAKTAQTSVSDTIKGNLKDGGSVAVMSNDNSNGFVYDIVYNRAAAQTGKAISNFELSTSDNAKLKDYNNNKTYDVSVSGDKFKVTLPNEDATLYPSFELSEGAKLFVVTGDPVDDQTTFTEVKSYKEDDGTYQSTIVPSTEDKVYFVADEYLATAMDNKELDGKDYDQLKNGFKGHFTQYTFEATEKANTGRRLTAISANGSKVTGSVSGDKITLNVPYSYAEWDTDNKEFFFDFTVDAGAKLSFNDAEAISGGRVTLNAEGEIDDVETPAANNPKFKINKTAGDPATYDLQVNVGEGYVDVTSITVTPEAGDPYIYEIAKINVAKAETAALLTSVKVNNTSASINNTAKTVTVALPYGTNLGQVKIDMKASDMATIVCGSYDVTNPDEVYDLTKGLRITVISESLNTVNEYTLTATTAAQFSDVSTDDWFYQNVMDAVAAGIVSGRGDGTFGPNDRITRRDFAIMVSKLLLDGEDAPEATTTPFSDVSADDYALNAIAYCAENGIISGFDGEFRPSDNITRQEAASVMKNALELTGTTSELFADDAAIATWAKANVYACKAAGVFNGDDNNNFNPTSTLTRAEAASIMVNAMK